MRDADALSANGFPVFSAGLNPCGPTKSIAGRVNYPVSVAGAAIQPGDLVIGDIDGVVVLPREDVPALLELAQKNSISRPAVLQPFVMATFARRG